MISSGHFSLWLFLVELIIVSSTTSFIAVIFIAYKDSLKRVKIKKGKL